MFWKRFGEFILKNRVQALGTTLLCSFLPFVGPASVVIAAFVTLCRGAYEGSLVLVVACAPFILGYVASGSSDYDFILNAVVIILLSSFLTWFYALILAKTHSWSVTLQVATLLSIIAICVVHYLYPQIDQWWQVKLTDYFTKALNMSGEGKTLLSSSMSTQDLVRNLKDNATGYVAGFVSFYALIQLALARLWQATIFQPGALQIELHNIRLSNVAGGFFIAVFIGSYWQYKVVIDILPVVVFTFSLAGLSLIHYLAQPLKHKKFILFIVYLLLSIIPPLMTLLAFLALVDTAVDIRKRVKQTI